MLGQQGLAEKASLVPVYVGSWGFLIFPLNIQLPKQSLIAIHITVVHGFIS